MARIAPATATAVNNARGAKGCWRAKSRRERPVVRLHMACALYGLKIASTGHPAPLTVLTLIGTTLTYSGALLPALPLLHLLELRFERASRSAPAHLQPALPLSSGRWAVGLLAHLTPTPCALATDLAEYSFSR